LDFDDVLLVPRASNVNSREEVDISVQLSDDLTLDIPIIASPMKGITGVELVLVLARLGGIGILHRFYDTLEKWESDILTLSLSSTFGVAVGLGEMQKVDIAMSVGAGIICIDVANGYLESVLNFTDKVSNKIAKDNYKSLVMVGNVATADGARNLKFSGANLIRVGIGSGNLCTTRNVTGVGVPQLTALKLSSSINERRNTDPRIVADGGIRNSGDAVKSFVFGADAVMLGSLLATTYESSNNGIIYGMASRKLQGEYYHSVKSVEGIEQQVTPRQSLAKFIEEFTWGIKSACTYLNAENLRQLRGSQIVTTGTGSIKKIGT
jgi:IMP dehydrogenase